MSTWWEGWLNSETKKLSQRTFLSLIFLFSNIDKNKNIVTNLEKKTGWEKSCSSTNDFCCCASRVSLCLSFFYMHEKSTHSHYRLSVDKRKSTKIKFVRALLVRRVCACVCLCARICIVYTCSHVYHTYALSDCT